MKGEIVTTTMLALTVLYCQAPGASKRRCKVKGFKYGGWQSGWDARADKIMDRRYRAVLLGRLTCGSILCGFLAKAQNHGKPFDGAPRGMLSQITTPLRPEAAHEETT